MNHVACFESPLGALTVEVSDAGVHRIAFDRGPPGQAGAHPLLARVRDQLDAYFNGQQHSFDLPLAPQGTGFQQRVWQALLTVDYGRTCSYAAIAAAIEAPRAVRAVGAANGRNPIAIVIPCHRVIGSSGRLTGYSAGLSRKEALLQLEAGTPTVPYRSPVNASKIGGPSPTSR
jgi:methylated-DNA-[protein]-cysteine S-methyltransferase